MRTPTELTRTSLRTREEVSAGEGDTEKKMTRIKRRTEEELDKNKKKKEEIDKKKKKL